MLDSFGIGSLEVCESIVTGVLFCQNGKECHFFQRKLLGRCMRAVTFLTFGKDFCKGVRNAASVPERTGRNVCFGMYGWKV